MTGVQTCALPICNQKVGKNINTKQNTDTYRNRGCIGDRSTNLIKLIGAERVSRRNYKYEGTYYVTEDGELYNKEHVINQKDSNDQKNQHSIINGPMSEKVRKTNS